MKLFSLHIIGKIFKHIFIAFMSRCVREILILYEYFNHLYRYDKLGSSCMGISIDI